MFKILFIRAFVIKGGLAELCLNYFDQKIYCEGKNNLDN